jgi:hypothetical protein
MFCLPRFTPWLLASLAVCLLLTPPAMAQRVKNKLTVKLPSSIPTGGEVTGTVTRNTVQPVHRERDNWSVAECRHVHHRPSDR